jgi:GH25 family lysozyme M1 (1,4-beta-N-acetylmuramidase)
LLPTLESLEPRRLFAAPPTPTPLLPGTEASPGPGLDTLTPTFSWQASAGATRYGLYVRDLSTNTLVVNRTDLATNSYRVPSGILKNQRAYRWNVTAWNASNQQSGISSLRHFESAAPRVNGIDVSRWQLSVNWPQVRAAGVEFVFMKATEATNHVDPNFAVNRAGAIANNVITGFYHRARPLTNTAVAEADHFVNTISPHLVYGRMRPVLDLEEGHENGKQWLSDWAVAFLDRVEQRTGVRPIVYMNTWYASTYTTTALRAWPLWIANYIRDPLDNPPTGVWPDWNVWQYTDSGRVNGIGTNVDLNVFNGTRPQLLQQLVIQPRKGDLNGDGVVNNQDIAAFTLALTDPAAYQQQHPLFSASVIGDLDSNGVLNNQDIAPFVASLTASRPTPSATMAEAGVRVSAAPVRVAQSVLLAEPSDAKAARLRL